MKTSTTTTAVPGTAATTIEWMPTRGTLRRENASRALLREELYRARTVRQSVNYPKKRNYQGECFIAATGQSVFYESLLERRALHWLDFTCELAAVSTQPMRIRFADGSEHYPDILALHTDRRQVVYDVKPMRFVEKFRHQFENTAALCRQVGWGYQVITDFTPVFEQNLAVLADHRTRLFQPAATMRDQILAAVDGPTPIREAAAAVDWEVRHAAVPAIHHLLWHGALKADLNRSVITGNTLIWKAAGKC